MGRGRLAEGDVDPYFAGQTKTSSGDDLYFSFVTLATLGYGDFVPALGIGRALSVLEAVTGQLYLVTVAGAPS